MPALDSLPAKLIERAREDVPRFVELLTSLVAIDSPSKDKTAADQLGAHLRTVLETAGASVEVHRQNDFGDALLARFKGDASDHPILLLGHLDTVWPAGEAAKRPFEVCDDRAKGPGAFDMKGGLAIAIRCLTLLKELELQTPRDVLLLVNADAECGSPASTPLIESIAGDACAAMVLLGGPPSNALRTARKGIGLFQLTIVPDGETVIDPNRELMEQLLSISGLGDTSKGISLSVGAVRGDKTSKHASNAAKAELDVRVPTSEDGERIEVALGELTPLTEGTRIEVEGAFTRPPMERTEANVALFEKARTLAASLGIEVRETSSGTSSDGNVTSALGVPTLDGLGVIGWGTHSIQETVLLDRVPDRLALLGGLLLSELGDLRG